MLASSGSSTAGAPFFGKSPPDDPEESSPCDTDGSVFCSVELGSCPEGTGWADPSAAALHPDRINPVTAIAPNTTRLRLHIRNLRRCILLSLSELTNRVLHPLDIRLQVLVKTSHELRVRLTRRMHRLQIPLTDRLIPQTIHIRQRLCKLLELSYLLVLHLLELFNLLSHGLGINLEIPFLRSRTV